jgi:hypothetical protein
MPILFLNLKRLPSLALSATCSISGNAGSMHGLTRIFAKEQDAEAAFKEAGIDEHRYAAFQLPTSSTPIMMPSSMSVSRDSPLQMTMLPGGGS